MILLDTHVWLWWAADVARLSRRARAAMDRSPELGVSVVSCWEAAMLAHRGRIGPEAQLPSWQEQALQVRGVVLVPLTRDIAIRAAGLQAGRGGDAADWFLVATALELQIPLVTKDERLRQLELVETIW